MMFFVFSRNPFLAFEPTPLLVVKVSEVYIERYLYALQRDLLALTEGNSYLIPFMIG